MKTPLRLSYRAHLVARIFFLVFVICNSLQAQTDRQIPILLQPWQQWATWSDTKIQCPPGYQNADQRFCSWPSRMEIDANAQGGRFTFQVQVFAETRVGLPGGRDMWPVEVVSNGGPVPVIERNGAPSVLLSAGEYRIEGVFFWKEMPQTIPLPVDIGVVALRINGSSVEFPVWDAQGQLWLRRDRVQEGETSQDFLSMQVYGLLEDGIPMWLRTEVELVVSGKSREEEIGVVIPEGWRVAAINSPIPVALDDNGRLKAQVRPGKWKIRLDAFRLDDPREVGFEPGRNPPVENMLIAFRAKPDFRMVDLLGMQMVDVSQTTFPDDWRQYPVYRWDTSAPFQIEERMRGMGLQKPAGLDISRQLWLEEGGKELVFRDRISGTMQQIWRLDAAEGIRLGSVRSDGEGQLITINPESGAPGVEIRMRQIDLEATGTMTRGNSISSTGWRADAGSVRATLNLPPGWRLLALFGADWVQGDWLTSWTLLDLFLLLIFSLAVFRLWGFLPAVLAFVAFGLSFHEPGAPRYVWLALLVPLALLRVVPQGRGHKLLQIWKWVTVAFLVMVLIPFLVEQVQQTLYPQLERTANQPAIPFSDSSSMVAAPQEDMDMVMESAAVPSRGRQEAKFASPKQIQKQKENLLYDPKAKIQTGPGIPDWTWRTVEFGWSGPVTSSQNFNAVLIPVGVERMISILRVLLLLALAGLLLNARRFKLSIPSKKMAAVPVLFASMLIPTGFAQAQFPDQQMLETLRNRLLEPSEAFPNAAEIPLVSLSIKGRVLSMESVIHTAARCAVPLPGRLPAWSPVRVLVDGIPYPAVRRNDGFLWIVLPEGVHQVAVEGVISNAAEWEWAFHLKPRRVVVEAPGWNVSGIHANGVPDQQVFFSRQEGAERGEAGYDVQELSTLALVERRIEFGLIWQVRTTVTRLTPAGRAISLQIPLLPGENVLTPNTEIQGGKIRVQIGANASQFSWESELPVTDSLNLVSAKEDLWVEQWHLVVSPVWNVAFSGLPPIFEPGIPSLLPVWSPWPGESVDLKISRPESVPGQTMTIDRVGVETSFGQRQRTSMLDLSIRASLGEDFFIDLPADAEITSLTKSGTEIPVRRDGSKVIVPLRPGLQQVVASWKTDVPLQTKIEGEQIQLPVESANINTTFQFPDNRWVLWTYGPLRGPAVQFWTILICSLVAALALSRVPHSPLRASEWMLLAIGLTQVSLPASIVVVAWLFCLAWRGRESLPNLRPLGFNTLQILLAILTVVSLGALLGAVAQGLLGRPEMFLSGNGSTRSMLRWYSAEAGSLLPQPGCISVSIWWYRFFMLVWALWLATALLRWLTWGWGQFSSGGCFRKGKPKSVPPPIS